MRVMWTAKTVLATLSWLAAQTLLPTNMLLTNSPLIFTPDINVFPDLHEVTALRAACTQGSMRLCLDQILQLIFSDGRVIIVKWSMNYILEWAMQLNREKGEGTKKKKVWPVIRPSKKLKKFSCVWLFNVHLLVGQMIIALTVICKPDTVCAWI